MELYKTHRPQRLEDLKGQQNIVTTLTKMLENKRIPHSILLSGNSGCGKTTIARILTKELGCSKNDCKEMNAANYRGIEMVREIQSQANLTPLSGACRVWIIDECHQLTTPAQDAFLKLLEDTPKHVYFFLATTNPEKLKKTVKNRCMDIVVKPLTKMSMTALLRQVSKKEKFRLGKEPCQEIIKVADGSARKALVLLDSIIGLEPKEQLQKIYESDHEVLAIRIARALINENTTWDQMADILQGVKEDPESLRWMILGYCNTILLRGGAKAPRAFLIIDTMRDNFYDSKHAGLSAACFDIIKNL